MGASEMGEPTPPIGNQISALAELAPDAPAVTCDGRTLTRAELDATTNRLARAYKQLGVGVGDYVTIVRPNSSGFRRPSRAGSWARSHSRCPHGCPTPSSRDSWSCGRGHWWSAGRIREANHQVCPLVSH